MIKENRFSHLKKKNPPLTPDEFAAGAIEKERKNSKKKISRVKVLLTIVGKMNRSEDCEKSYQLYLRNDIKNDIERYCIGNMQSLINYLARRGLDDLIAKDTVIIEENI